MMISRPFGLGLVLAAAMTCRMPVDQPAALVDSDAKRLVGSWKVVAAEEGGRGIDETALIAQTLEFAADGTYRFLVGETVIESGEFTLDPDASPKAIDLRIRRGPDAGKTQWGLYRFDGELLILSFNKAGVESRPKDFKTGPDTGQFTFQLKRWPMK